MHCIQDCENQFIEIISYHGKEHCEGDQPLPAVGDGKETKKNFLPRAATLLAFSSCVEIKAVSVVRSKSVQMYGDIHLPVRFYTINHTGHTNTRHCASNAFENFLLQVGLHA